MLLKWAGNKLEVMAVFLVFKEHLKRSELWNF